MCVSCVYILFQYSKNLEGTKTENKGINLDDKFQYSKNLEGTKTRTLCYG